MPPKNIPFHRPALTNERAAQAGRIELIVHTHCARRDWFNYEGCCNREIQIAQENASLCVGVSRQQVDSRDNEAKAMRVRYAALAARYRSLEHMLQRRKERNNG